MCFICVSCLVVSHFAEVCPAVATSLSASRCRWLLGSALHFLAAATVVDHGAYAAETDVAARLVLVLIGAPCRAYHALGVFP